MNIDALELDVLERLEAIQLETQSAPTPSAITRAVYAALADVIEHLEVYAYESLVYVQRSTSLDGEA